MDGIHDFGGKHGFGEVATTDSLVGFAERWHGSVFTMVNSLGPAGVVHNTDHFRHAVERIDPVSYLTDGYYGRWLGGAETLLVEAGIISQQQLTDRALSLGAHETDRIAARPQSVGQPLQRDPTLLPPPTAQREQPQPPLFAMGDCVLTRMAPVAGHTRLPAYVRGRLGTIVALHGAWVYPDTNAHDQGEQPQHLYTVCFDAQELWAAEATAGLEVCVDLFEPYLNLVEEA